MREREKPQTVLQDPYSSPKCLKRGRVRETPYTLGTSLVDAKI